MSRIHRMAVRRYNYYMDDDGRSDLIRYVVGFLVLALALAGFMEWLDFMLAPAPE